MEHDGESRRRSTWGTATHPNTEPAADGDSPQTHIGRLLVSRYRLGHRLGQGAYGKVYAALDERTGEEVAVKLVRTLSAQRWEQVRRELVALRWARLPGVVRLLDDGTDGAEHFIVMVRVHGRPYPGGAARRWEAVREVTLSLLEALARLHAVGLLHRDLKPANVLVDERGHATLVDLGLATEIVRGECQWGGTILYAAPEQLAERPLDARTDLYAVGVMLYEALTGRIPSLPEGTPDAQRFAWARLLRPPRPLAEVCPDVPTAVADTVMRLLARDPADRFDSATDVLRALGGSLERLTPTLASLPPRATARQLSRLFHGPEHFLHLPSDAARELWNRTGGEADAVRAELTAWIRAGLCHWDEGRVRIERQAIERLAAGLGVDATPRDLPPLSEPAADLLARIQLAWPDTRRALVADRKCPEALEELFRLGLAWRLPDGRLGTRVGITAGAHWPEERRRAFHAELAHRCRADAARVRHRIRAGDVRAADLLAPLERCVESGDHAAARPALELALQLARHDGSAEDERRVLTLLAVLALAQEARAPLEAALLEIERAEMPDPTVRQIELLVRGALAARNSEVERAKGYLEAVDPFTYEPLEHWRQSVLAHDLPRARPGKADLSHLVSWVAAAPAEHRAERQALAAGWLGLACYAEARFQEAADLHAVAYVGKRAPLGRLSSLHNRAIALLDGGRPEEALEAAREAARQARALRHPRYEASATGIARSAACRLGTPLRARPSMVYAAMAVVDYLGGVLAVHESVVAWRGGQQALARRLADLAMRTLSAPQFALLHLFARGVAALAGVGAGAAESLQLAREVARCADDPLDNLQLFAMLAPSSSEAVAAARRAVATASDEAQDQRGLVLSRAEALEMIERASSPNCSGPQQPQEEP